MIRKGEVKCKMKGTTKKMKIEAVRKVREEQSQPKKDKSEEMGRALSMMANKTISEITDS